MEKDHRWSNTSASAVFLQAFSISRDSYNSFTLLRSRVSFDSSISSSMLSFSHSAISSDGLFTYEISCFLSTDFRSAGGFLSVFSSSKQNFVGIYPGFKLICEQGSKLKKSLGRLLATNWRNIVARCKFSVASLCNVQVPLVESV